MSSTTSNNQYGDFDWVGPITFGPANTMATAEVHSVKKTNTPRHEVDDCPFLKCYYGFFTDLMICL